MKLKIKRKKIIIAFIFILILCTAFIGNSNNSVLAKINEHYGTGAESGTIDLEQASKDSTILSAIGLFLYVIAGWIEDIVGWLIGSFTGSNVFPWADRVIFNTIPFLDVNFLSPSNGSMFRDISGENTIFGDIIANTYMTIFTLAIAFFGVVVGIMALKLAISSIASEKAKYKQAIMNWLMALILIFTVHYLISFIFFVNEKMVEVASSILKTQIEQNEEKIDMDFSVIPDTEVAETFFDSYFKLYYFVAEKLVTNEDVYICTNFGNIVTSPDTMPYGWLPVKLATNGDRVTDSTGKEVGVFNYEFFKTTSNNVKIVHKTHNKYNFENNGGWSWTDTQAGTALEVTDEKFLKRFQTYLAALCSNNIYIKKYRINVSEAVENATGFLHEINLIELSDKQAALVDLRRIINDALFLTNYDSTLIDITGLPDNRTINGESDINFRYYLEKYIEESYIFDEDYLPESWRYGYPKNTSNENWEEFINIFLKMKSNIDSNSNVNYVEEDILTNMSEFFKENVYISDINIDADNSKGEEVFNVKFQPIVAILYAIFIIQSIMYFIAYMKRFFYIIILALFAPIVIIYDFLMKSSMT